MMLALACIVPSGCERKTDPAQSMERPPAPVNAVAAIVRDVPVYLDQIGKCAAREAVMIQSQVSGQITQILFDDGADLKKGTPLFVIDPRPFEAQLHQADAMAAKDQANATNARAFAKRQEEVFRQRSISAMDYDQARFAADAAEATVRADKAMVEMADLNLKYCRILSPIDGRAGQRLVDVGNVVKLNDTNLLSIQRLEPIYADFTIPERQLTDVRRYMTGGTLRCLVSLPNDKAPARQGELTFLDNAVQDASGTIKLRATIPNSDSHFWPGQFVNVRLVLTHLKDAVLVPSSAPQLGQRGPYVYVVGKDQSVAMRPIVPGQPQGEWVVIESGVQPGEMVVTNGQLAVTPGGKVMVVPPAPGMAVAEPSLMGAPGAEGGRSAAAATQPDSRGDTAGVGAGH